MLEINDRLMIPDGELQWSFVRSGGPGGQMLASADNGWSSANTALTRRRSSTDSSEEARASGEERRGAWAEAPSGAAAGDEVGPALDPQ